MNSEELAWKIRRHSIDMVNHAHASHIGGVLSVADAVAVLYNDIAKVDALRPRWEERDRIILSKGHNGVAIYSALAELGFYPVEELQKYGDNGCRFSCHVSHKGVPGVEISTGSLGQGVCVACGMALNGKLKNMSYHVYAIMGDGECNEGSVWETIMLAAQYRLDNFTVLVDCNDMQAMGKCEQVMNMYPMRDKWQAFGWLVEEADGHNHNELREAFKTPHNGRPKVILSHTIKGKGVSYMEGQLIWHYRDPQGEFYERAVQELEAQRP